MDNLNFVLLAAETSRSRLYLQALISNKIEVKKVLILKNFGKKLPGQEDKFRNEIFSSSYLENVEYKPYKKLESSCLEAHINFQIINEVNVNSEKIIRIISNLEEEIIIYSGYGGTILRSDILSCGKKFLHVHGGFLPDYRGSTTNYYSALKEKYIGASSIIMSREIDEGPIIYRKKFNLPKDLSLLDHYYDSFVRAYVLIKTIRILLKVKNFEDDLIHQKNEFEVLPYYIIHPLLKHLSILKSNNYV